MRKILVFLLILTNLTLLYIAYQLLTPLISAGNAALIIDTSEIHAVVSMNGKVVGTTPYKADKLRPGDYNLKLTADLEASDSAIATASGKLKIYKASWENSVTLTPGTQTVINRTFGPSAIFSAGEVLTLEGGSGLNIVTNPSEADISLDSKSAVKSPLTTADTGTHVVKINKDGYFGRELTVNIPTNFKLKIMVDLALNPLTPLSEIDKHDKIKLLDLSSSSSQLLANSQNWSDGVFFYNSKLASPSAHLDLLIDSKGATYSATLKGWEAKIKETQVGNIGYLGKKDEPLTTEAKKVWDSLTLFLTGTPSGTQVQISTTPTGFLNVRSEASLSASIISKITPGEKFLLLEEKTSWYHIKLPDGKDGWISSQYAKKL